MSRWKTLQILLLLAAAVPVVAEDDPKKEFLEGIGKAMKAGDADRIGDCFPAEGTIKLKLLGVKNDGYRAKQAKSLLATYFKAIEPKKVKLKEVGRTFGRFTMEYKVRADATTVEKTVTVSLQKEGDSWLIVGIVES